MVMVIVLCPIQSCTWRRARSPSRDVRRPAVVLDRQRYGEGAKGGDLTGPSPTDRAKKGSKRHILTDAQGIPLAVVLTGANVHDKWMVGATLDACIFKASRGPRRP